MTSYEGQVRKVVHDLVDQLHLLGGKRHPRAGNAGTAKDRKVQLTAQLVDGVHLRVVDRHLWIPTRREGSNRPQSGVPMESADSADRLRTVVGVGLMAGNKTVRVLLDHGPAFALVRPDADHGQLHVVAVHEREAQVSPLGWILRFTVTVPCLVRERDVLEHVLGRKVHGLRVGVPDPGEVGVVEFGVRPGPGAHHGVDGRHVGGERPGGHGPILRSDGPSGKPWRRERGQKPTDARLPVWTTGQPGDA